MVKWFKDDSYTDIVKDILDNNEVKKLRNYRHHGIDRLEHCIRVSYYSYLVSKKLHLNYKSVARAGLIHDFFLVNNQEITLKERIKVLITHPKIALKNSKEQFKLTKMEENIIESHMFPIYFVLPKSIESIIVNTVDNVAAIYERYCPIRNSIKNWIHNIYKRTHITKNVKSN